MTSCTLCVVQISSQPLRTRRSDVNGEKNRGYSVWGHLFSVLGVGSEFNSVLFPICGSCNALLKDVLALSHQLDTLKKELDKKSGVLKVKVRESQGGGGHQFDPATINLRRQLLGQEDSQPVFDSFAQSERLPARVTSSVGSLGQGQGSRFVPSYQTSSEYAVGGQGHNHNDLLYPTPSLFSHFDLQTPQPPHPHLQQEQRSILPDGPQYFALVSNSSTSTQPPSDQGFHTPQGQSQGQGSSPFHQPDIHTPNNFSPFCHNQGMTNNSSSESPPNGEHPVHELDSEDNLGPPPSNVTNVNPKVTTTTKPKKKGGRVGKLDEAARVAMLTKRSVAEVETFSPITTTEEGRRFYDSHEILTLPSGTLECGTCAWREANDGTRPWLRLRSMKVHMKAVHQNGYKCGTCSYNFTCLKQLQKHACGDNSSRRRSLPNLRCDGCSKMFASVKTLSHHKIGLSCGIPVSQNVDPFGRQKAREGKKTRTRTRPSIKEIAATLPKGPCRICGRPNLTSGRRVAHLWTHKGPEEKAAAMAAGQGPCRTCEICGRPNLTSGRLDAHLWTHKGPEEKAAALAAGQGLRSSQKVMCETCGKLICLPHFQAHVHTHRSWDEEELARLENRVTCEVEGCGQSFPNKVKLGEHSRKVHKKKEVIPVTCPEAECKGRTFSSKKLLMTHSRRRHWGRKNPAFVCPICSTRRGHQTEMNRHIRVHQKAGQTAEMYTFLCSVENCGQKSISANALKSHMGANHPELRTTLNPKNKERKKGRAKKGRPPPKFVEDLPPFIKLDEGGGWKLEFLGYTVFKRKSGLICESCGKVSNFNFDREEEGVESDEDHIDGKQDGLLEKGKEIKRKKAEKEMKLHIKAVHREDYKCELCGRLTNSLQGLAAHHRTVHLPNIPVPCPVCEGPFFPDEISDHVWSHRGVEDFMAALNRGESLPSVYMTLPNHFLHSEQDEVKIKCDHCPEEEEEDEDHGFTTLASFYQHILKHHPKLFEPEIKKRKWRARQVKVQRPEIDQSNQGEEEDFVGEGSSDSEYILPFTPESDGEMEESDIEMEIKYEEEIA